MSTLEHPTESATQTGIAVEAPSRIRQMSALPVPGTAAWRLYRLMLFVAGIGVVIYLLIPLPAALVQFPAMRPPFGAAAYAALLVLATTMSVLALVVPIRWLCGVATAYALCSSIVLVGWVPAQIPETLPTADMPWLLGTVPAATTIAVMAWRPAWAWPYLVLNCIGTGIVRYFADPAVGVSLTLQDTCYRILMSVVLAGLVLLVQRAARQQDQTLALAEEEAERAAATAARTQQRARFRSLVHDEVLATFIAAAHGSPQDDPLVARAAWDTLQSIAAFATPDAVPGASHEPREAAARLRSALRGNRTRTTAHVSRTRPVPASVVEAFAVALAEAERNVERHAGPSAHCDVTIALDEADILCTIADDGIGYDPAKVPRERLGSRVSIVGRMHAIGGGARIRSTVGKGTFVTLWWSDDGE